MLRFPCLDRSVLTCTIIYESLYEIPRPYCLEDEVMAMTSLSGLFRMSLVMSLFSYLQDVIVNDIVRLCHNVIVSLLYISLSVL
jgi:hypothetical protein